MSGHDDPAPGTPPLAGAYWVEAGRLIAGPYPGGWNDTMTERQLAGLLDAGLTTFVDLTEAGEVAAYVLALYAQAARRGRTVRHVRRPVPDMDVPDWDTMIGTLDLIDTALAAGETVYVHCLGGIGRTGTVVGCYLVRHGLDPDAALETIVRLRGGLTDSPQTAEQYALVRGWRAGQ